jgi:Fe-S-cluster-containing hydrogenase component 2
MPKRKIVEIDEAKCDGCGQCVPACAEGAIQIVGGKARLVSDVYCDGLGACLGECPKDAIRIIEREAEPFDEQAAQEHVGRIQSRATQTAPLEGCPGAAMRILKAQAVPRPAAAGSTASADTGHDTPGSALRNWPVQLQLVPPGAPFLKNADLLLAADCVPFAFADFHRRLLRQHPLLIGCPKLDDAGAYVEKLAAILNVAMPKSLTVVHMEVPCCTGLLRIAQAAMQTSGISIPLGEVTISIQGEIVQEGAGPTPQT